MAAGDAAAMLRFAEAELSHRYRLTFPHRESCGTLPGMQFVFVLALVSFVAR